MHTENRTLLLWGGEEDSLSTGFKSEKRKRRKKKGEGEGKGETTETVSGLQTLNIYYLTLHRKHLLTTGLNSKFNAGTLFVAVGHG